MTTLTSTLAPALAAGLGLPQATLDASVAAPSPFARGSARTGAVPVDVLLELAGAVGSRAAKASASTTKKTSGTTAKKTTGTSTAKKTTGTSTTKKATGTSAAGYAATAAALPKDLAFLRDKKLSVEDKLMRLAVYLNAKNTAEIEKRMEELGGAAAKSGTGSTTGTGGSTAAKPKKKGFWGGVVDALKTGLPAVGLSVQMLKTPATKAMLKQLGGPVLAAAATALGFPHAAPALLKLGPKVVDYAAGALQAVEKAAAAEQQAGASAASSGSSSSAGAPASLSAKDEQIKMLELNQLVDKQKEMMALVSNMLKSMHDTKSHVINNLR